MHDLTDSRYPVIFNHDKCHVSRLIQSYAGVYITYAKHCLVIGEYPKLEMYQARKGEIFRNAVVLSEMEY